jgi:hypothetical protein
MQRQLPKIGLLGLVTALSGALLSVSPYAAERKDMTISGKSKRMISETKAAPGDTPNHEFAQNVRVDTWTSSNPDFNNVDMVLYEHDDCVAGSCTHRGYAVSVPKDGDQFYTRYEGTHRVITKEGGAWEVPFEGRIQFTGGTGRYKNLKGDMRYRGMATPEQGVQYEYHDIKLDY